MKVVSYYEFQTFRWDHYDATVFYYINTGKLLFKIQGLFKDHILEFQGPYLLLFILRFDINYQNILIIMGLFFLMATIFYENSFVIAYQRITFRNEQTIIVTMLLIKCSSIKIQGLSRTKMNEREFQRP